jgi:Raf kinase inhibitor-like YbhB/YbcL family protein
MFLTSNSFDDGAPIPPQFAFARPADEGHVELSDNRSPHLMWGDVPTAAKSLALICVDVDVPSVGDDVNQEGRSVPADLPRVDFYHWVMVDLPAKAGELVEGVCSDGITARGKQDPAGPSGSRQGVTSYTAWFATDADMSGTYKGYDGPASPWNDERLHHYHFRMFAIDLERCPVEGDFSGPEVMKAIEGHIVGVAEWVGTYTQNPSLIGA